MKTVFLKHILPLALLASCAAGPDPDVAHFLEQARAEPELRIADAYKWLFHATRGGEHAVADEIAARQWLETEWATLGPPPSDEPLWVPLAADGRIGRLNLRPYRAQGGDPDALHAAFVRGAASFDADPARFRKAWRALGRELKNRPSGHLTAAEWRRFDRDLRARGYPACHHSPAYEQARSPAYRVLPAAEAQALLDALPAPPR
ncbi:MAG: hypothetical protein AB7V22_05730 [Kiritimatiellia bacterium]